MRCCRTVGGRENSTKPKRTTWLPSKCKANIVNRWRLAIRYEHCCPQYPSVCLIFCLNQFFSSSLLYCLPLFSYMQLERYLVFITPFCFNFTPGRRSHIISVWTVWFWMQPGCQVTVIAKIKIQFWSERWNLSRAQSDNERSGPQPPRASHC